MSQFTFCRDLRTFSANFFGQNSILRNITRFLHVCDTVSDVVKKVGAMQWRSYFQKHLLTNGLQEALRYFIKVEWYDQV